MSTVANNAITYTNGDSYTGQILAHGTGKMVHANGDVYEGEFDMGKRNNKGVYKYINGEKYCVRERNKLQLAADLLAKVTEKMKKLAKLVILSKNGPKMS